MVSKKTSWGAVADWYDELLEDSADSFQKNVILPNMLRIVAPKKDMKILDVACGQGYFSRAFADGGAEVIGCDISPELVEIAKKQGGATGLIHYHVAPADKLSFAKDGSFDAVTIVLALQNIENLAGTVSECARVLKPDGRFVFVLNHPAFRIPKASSWQWDEHSQFRRVDSYMSDSSVKIDMTPGEKDETKKEFTVSFHRPLQSYIKALSKAGLCVSRLEEWISHRKSQPGPRAAEEDRMRKEIPMFLCVEAKR